MIEVYKIVSGKYDSAITPTLIILDTHQTRGNDLRHQKSCLKYDMRTGRLISVDASLLFFEESLRVKNQLDPPGRFDRTPTCDRQTQTDTGP